MKSELKREFLIAISVMAGVALLVWLVGMFGSTPELPPQKAVHHKPRPATPELAAQSKPKPGKPARPPREIVAGTADYLDAKNGFRDVQFGQVETEFTNLVLQAKDEARQLATYTRSGDVLNMEGVPLQNIEYTFFNGQLVRVSLKWKTEYPDSTLALPPSTEMAGHCSELYGRPKKQSVKKDAAQYCWSGKKVKIILDEFRLPGVTNMDKGGWAIPPTTSGQMVFESIPARLDMQTVNANQVHGSQTGL